MAEKKEFPEEGELVLCTVEKILKTSVFVKVDDYDKIGILTTAEISPGRIRNIRDFVTPNKRIVCKVLRVDPAKGHIDLSLRRVSLKDRKDLLEEFTREKNALAILGKVITENLNSIVENIKKEHPKLYVFLQSANENPQLFNKFEIKDEDIKKIQDLIKERIKTKKFEIKTRLKIEGIKDINVIKEALKVDNKKVKISYVSAPFYIMEIGGKDYKEINHLKDKLLKEIEEKIEKAGGELTESEIAKMS